MLFNYWSDSRRRYYRRRLALMRLKTDRRNLFSASRFVRPNLQTSPSVTNTANGTQITSCDSWDGVHTGDEPLSHSLESSLRPPFLSGVQLLSSLQWSRTAFKVH